MSEWIDESSRPVRCIAKFDIALRRRVVSLKSGVFVKLQLNVMTLRDAHKKREMYYVI
jgi:hypothetical protein